MDVVARVAIAALALECCLADPARVAALASELLVRPLQPEARLALVIEGHALPSERRVARATVIATLSAVYVVDAMAAYAAQRERPTLGPGGRCCMAALARNSRVPSAQGELGAGVIEAPLLPSIDMMTALALRSESALVCVIDHVAAATASRGVLVAGRGMTGSTRRLGVAALE